jgi:hypothetical protein
MPYRRDGKGKKLIFGFVWIEVMFCRYLLLALDINTIKIPRVGFQVWVGVVSKALR